MGGAEDRAGGIFRPYGLKQRPSAPGLGEFRVPHAVAGSN
jgi:hypothetical protein